MDKPEQNNAVTAAVAKLDTYHDRLEQLTLRVKSDRRASAEDVATAALDLQRDIKTFHQLVSHFHVILLQRS